MQHIFFEDRREERAFSIPFGDVYFQATLKWVVLGQPSLYALQFRFGDLPFKFEFKASLVSEYDSKGNQFLNFLCNRGSHVYACLLIKSSNIGVMSAYLKNLNNFFHRGVYRNVIKPVPCIAFHHSP